MTDAPPHEVGDCPDGLDFTVEVEAVLVAGCAVDVVTDWRSPGDGWDDTWGVFSGLAGFYTGTFATIVALHANPSS
ncbi:MULTISPECIES: hypothetical protein [unclassified Frankia]|uniref:hypothetical protein n=1 Tax=unclassified Frankia TaxID=2632575 RepID=UPI002AD4A439|nr:MULTISPECIES: hypothetical protein [unclassified Frankia]